MKATKSFGICIGATTLSAVEVARSDDKRIRVQSVYIRPHNGNPREALLEALEHMKVNGDARIALTGRKFRHAVSLSSIAEPEAVESALTGLNGRGEAIDTIVSAGGESFMVYVLTRDGKISSVQTGNKCASGTGEFFMQQLRRMGLSPEEAARYAVKEKPYRVSGRCSVFCKSDCTHATNKGVPKGRIAAGLCEMMAAKIIDIVKQVRRNDIMLIGGTAQNTVMIDYLEKEIGRVIVPPEAPYFEALGSAVWALDHETEPLPKSDGLFRQNGGSFSYHQPLGNFAHLVDFKTMERGVAEPGDRCLLGLDVGSTTTKAVLLRMADDRVLASVYLRTKGNPVEASRECYADLCRQLAGMEEKIEIAGLGVTGSGRQIAGLHALSEGIINEIIAHAAAALFFDPTVDTIFEIGGQDAKYTYIRNGVPSDYAMNDACSAGTGSFLEEAAREAMGLEMERIGEIAFRGRRPPNFNDQCAAFISSDIKTASHEGVEREDIVAGLVYSVCMNYNNRVKGKRPVGNNVFMQGGVCYNRAVPVAMAALTGKRIVVPPEPGLMGAFGVALEVKRRLKLKLLKERPYSLGTLRDRALTYGSPFTCRGGREGCDRKCEIARIEIEGKVYPFGGACNRWYNQRFNIAVDAEKLDLVRTQEMLIFRQAADEARKDGRVVGLNKSFMTNSYMPLYRKFFSGLGLHVVIPERLDQDGVGRKRAPFCYPAEISHGYLADLLEKKPDYLFLPHIKGVRVEKDSSRSLTCPISQGEPYYLASAFKDHRVFKDLREKGRVLTPVIDFSGGMEAAAQGFIETAGLLGYGKKKAGAAFSEAVKNQEQILRTMKEAGLKLLRDLEGSRESYGVAIFGRSYNALVSEANMGIPHKFSSRGVPVVPFDFLPIEEEIGEEGLEERMYWSTGKSILRGASYVRKHPQLFGCYITNFSCGPDSFLLEYFRNLMGRKPFLILELDSHVADAGLETRIEAFMDIVRNYRELDPEVRSEPVRREKKRAYYDGGRKMVVDSMGRAYPLDHPRVHLVFPSMGRFLLEATAAVFRSLGVRATALPPAGEEVLKLGRGNTSCKECLPLLLTVGTLLKYLAERENKDELLVYFMPTASGPCRFGQYSPYISQLLSRQEVDDVALFSLEAENSYTGAWGKDLTLRLWSGIVVSDVLQDIRSVLAANAVDRESALARFGAESKRILDVFEKSSRHEDLKEVLGSVARNLAAIPLIRTLKETPVVLLTGEIYVRHDDLSRQFIVDKLADQGFAAKVSGVAEWVYYTDWCYKNRLTGCQPRFKDLASLFLRAAWMRRYEKSIKKIMARSGLIDDHPEDVDRMIRNASPFISPKLTGEAILTIGGTLTEILDHCCGVIAIGPFGCMPNRVSEAILTREMSRDRESRRKGGKQRKSGGDGLVQELPFLAIESDGNPFPQIVTAKLEVFLLQAARVHQVMRGHGAG